MSAIGSSFSVNMRKRELEEKSKDVIENCDLAIKNIEILKNKVKCLPQNLNCGPNKLKQRFLDYMKLLIDYNYMITDFNMSVERLDFSVTTESMPVLDTEQPISSQEYSPCLMDVLSEPLNPISVKYQKEYVEKSSKKKNQVKKITLKKDSLIEFSSSDNSVGSSHCVLNDNIKEETERNNKEVETMLQHLSLKNDDNHEVILMDLPAQQILEIDTSYSGLIIYVDGPTLWLVEEHILKDLQNLTNEMKMYYQDGPNAISKEDMPLHNYCTFFDDPTDNWYRCFVQEYKQITDIVELYCVDIGEVKAIPRAQVKPLVNEFRQYPPFARRSHLAELDFDNNDEDSRRDLSELMWLYYGSMCYFQVEDNSSESLGVILSFENESILNYLILEKGLASPIKGSYAESYLENLCRGQLKETVEEIDITDCPEYEDALEAVTGYQNRDEADICKLYKGEPSKTCFKGSRCKKKHIMMHPDGWTLDKVPVLAGEKVMPLPEPGKWVKVLVTAVIHFDSVFLQIINDVKEERKLPIGVHLLPTTLSELTHLMNTPSIVAKYEPLLMLPALGEVVAAMYMDQLWYRARVINYHADDEFEVQYIDYGTVTTVNHFEVRRLNPSFMMLSFQAIKCKLAGVSSFAFDPIRWSTARNTLSTLVLNKTLDAQIVSRSYDEMVVTILDESGYSIADKLAVMNLTKVEPFSIDKEDNVTSYKYVLP